MSPLVKNSDLEGFLGENKWYREQILKTRISSRIFLFS